MNCWRWWVSTLPLLAAGCTCGAFDPATTRFACTTTEDCGPGYVCAPALGGLECVLLTADDGGVDAGAPLDAGVDAGTDAGVDGGIDAGIDADHDGTPLPFDCDDTNPAVHPGALEVCTDNVDDDCDGLTDCQQASCAGAACAGGGVCTGSTCMAATEVLCNDGLDNDGDGRIDCADSDCTPGTACSDFNRCTTGDHCVADGGCEKAADVACTTPPGACFSSAGVCLPDAGATCSYAPRSGSCDDGLACTVSDSCTAGACAGTPRVCASPPGVCFSPVGSCQEPSGTCSYVPVAGGTCNDSQNCTLNDQCTADGGCAGTPVICIPPTQCHAGGACDLFGGCLFTPRTGQSCDAGTGLGTCSAGFACVPSAAPLFPYTPTNFTEAQLPATDGGIHFDVLCASTLDTTVPTLTSNCASLPPFTVLTPAGGEPTLLFAVDSFTISGNKTLTITGSRPVIFAVLGNASLSGLIRLQNAAGSSSACGNGGTGVSLSAGFGVGGGGGAGFATAGGSGGAPGGAGAGASGLVNGIAQLVPLRGGCNGGAASSAGGVGGGALQISVAGSFVINDTIAAPGHGGTSAASNTGNGGGGGGSGGAILLEGTTVQVSATARLTANGGGGAGGGGFTATAGTAGSETTANPAAGGSGLINNKGGAGGCLNSGPGAGSAGSTQDQGGGGGGGAVGRIRINASTMCSVAAGAVVSPAATSNGACP